MPEIETKTQDVVSLLPGDEFWGDRPYKHDDLDRTGDGPVGDFMIFRVVGLPIPSVNTNLFGMRGDEHTRPDCIVVPVEYADGARGSRLYGVNTQITIRRAS